MIKYDTFNPYVMGRIPEGASVLDVGCATGLLGKGLGLRAKKGRLVGLEGNPAAAELARAYYDQVVVGDIEKGLFQALEGSRFDVIVCADILEHLRSPEKVLARLKTHLSDGGFFIISVPNVAFVSIRLSLLFGRFTYNPAGGIMDAEHLRFFTRKSLTEMLNCAGLEVVEVRGYNLVRRRFWFLKVLGRLIPALFCIQFVAEARAAGKSLPSA